MRKLSKTFVTGGFGLALLLLSGVGAASYLNVQRLNENKQWVEHTHQVLKEIDTISQGLADAQSGRRGYLITGKASHLETYNVGIKKTKIAIKAVRKLTIDNSKQQRRIDELEPLIAQRFSQLQRSIELLKNKKSDRLAEIALTNQGWEFQKEIEAKLAVMNQEEQTLLQQGSAATKASVQNTVIGIGVGYCLSFGLLFGVYILLQKQIRDRTLAESALQRSQLELQQVNEALETKVEERTAELLQINQALQAEIVERQRVEEELKKYALEFQDLYSNSPCGYHSLDKDGVFVRINDTELKMLGYTREEIVGKKKFSDLLMPESLPTFQENFPRFKQCGWVQDVEFQMVRKDGTIVPVSLSAIAIKDSAGNYLMSRSSILEITERKKAEIALQQQTQRQQLVMEISQRIRQSLNLEAILQTTVAEVRQFLDTDRVIIFRFEPDWSGTIVVESVGAEWTPTLSTTIYDPCFGESYVEPFKQGIVTAKADIYTAGISECHLDLLSHFQVRANLVVPILQNSLEFSELNSEWKDATENSRLWGLLIAHHCTEPRQWQPLEIDLLRQLATQVGIAIQQSTLFAQVKNELSDRKQAESALNRSNSILRSVLESTPDLIFVKDLQGRYVVANSITADWLGISVAEMLGKDDSEFFPNEIVQQFTQTDRRVITTGESSVYEELTPKEGMMRTLLTVKCPWRDAQGQIIGVIGISRDISDRKQAEQDLAKARDELEIRVKERTKELSETNAALKTEITERIEAEQKLEQTAIELKRSNLELEQFAYLASHDLQEPLRAVEGYTKLLVQEYQNLFDEPAQEYAEFIVDGTSRMRQLIQDLLAYSRVGTRGDKFISTDCNEVLSLALRDLQVAIAQSNATITYDSLPTVTADTMQLVQLFQNLIGNAIKFRRQEPPQIHISAKLKKNEYVFQVRDNGIGIKPRYLERIFEIFKRLHTRKEFPGTGIGLAICKKIVERHGGRIWAESQPGLGTTFYFTIPLTPDALLPATKNSND